MDNREAVMLPLLIENAGLIAICGCAGLILASAVGRWPVTNDAPQAAARVQAASAGVQAEGLASGQPESADAAGPQVAAAAPPQPSSPRMWMGADVQMMEFLRWCFRESYHTRKAVSGDPEGRYSDEEWFELYLLWAQRQHLQAIPETVFLTQLGKQTHCIKKSRERLKDPETGAVPRNANGTPMRATYYRLFLPAVVAMPAGKRARGSNGGTMRRAAA